MARPYKMTTDRGLQPDTSAVLYVKRDTMTNLWRLAWMVAMPKANAARVYSRRDVRRRFMGGKPMVRTHGIGAYREGAK